MYFHTPEHGPDTAAFKRAFVAAFNHAVQSESQQLVLAVHALTNLDGVISDALGEKVTKAVAKAPVTFEGVAVGLMTERIPCPFRGKAVFVAAHTSTAFLKKLESHHQQSDLFFVPWSEEEQQNFVSRTHSQQV